MLKQKIEKKLIDGDISDISSLIEEYEKHHKNDYDILSMKATYYVYLGDLEKAKGYLIESVKRNHYDVEAIYNLATVYELNSEFEMAYENYSKALILEEVYKDNVINIDEISNKLKEIMAILKERINGIEDEELQNYRLKELIKLNQIIRKNNDVKYNIFNNGKNIIGTYYEGTDLKKYYIGREDDWIHSYYAPEYSKNAIESKCELYEIYRKSKEVILNLNENYDSLVPIISNISSDAEWNELKFYNKKSNYEVFESEKCTYNYYKLSGKTKIKSVNEMIVGRPIELKKDSSKKSLVLNIFIDSLSYDYLKKNGFRELMPNTYDFFNKGVLCENVYSGSEFTYPSIATYVTGLYSSHHMMLNSALHMPLPNDITILAEYFKEDGYVTAKIGGNDSISPNYGYLRGIDRCVYQQQRQGFNVHQVIMDVIDHIEAFKESNQFIWMDIVDLHDVAGGFRRPISVQSKISLKYRECDNNGGNTVKQSYSINKQVIFKEELKRIDYFLSILYEYIQKNYSDDEIIVSLFSDHGTAFMVKDEDEFLSRTRTNVPLMIRSNYKNNTVCDEIISTADYTSIMCKLAGIEMKKEKIDGRLPKYFGGKLERKFAFSQSIFPGDPYRAVLHGKDFSYYLKGNNIIKNNCLINLDDFEAKLVDLDNNIILDEMKKEIYKSEIEKNIDNIYIY